MPDPTQWNVVLDNGQTVTVTAASEAEALAKAEAQSAGALPDAPAEPKSVSGFLGNVVSSTGDQFSNMYNAVRHIDETAKGLGNLALGIGEKLVPGQQDAEKYADAFAKFYVDRYGSLDQLGETAYKDPAGVAMDVASVAGLAGGGARALGAVGNLPKVTRIGKALSAVEAATNPTRPITWAANKALRGTGIGVIRSGNSPVRKIQDTFNVTPNEVARTIMDEGLLTESGAVRKAEASKAAAQGMLREAEQAGVPGGKVGDMADAVWLEIKGELDKVRAAGGGQQTAEINRLIERLDDFVAQHPTGEVGLQKLDELKRTMQSQAYETGQSTNTINRRIDQAMANQFAETERARVPGLQQQNRQSQKLIAAEQTIRDAPSRNAAGQLPTAVGLGAAASTGGLSAIPAYAAARVGTLPIVSRGAGITLGATGRMTDNAYLRWVQMLKALQEHSVPPPQPQP